MLQLIKHSHDEEEEVQEQNAASNISLWVDCYDDIFSDFDLRPYTSRNISDDFLRELRKLSHETDSHIDELRLLLPERARDKTSETIITKRLHGHFIKNLHYFQKKKKTEGKKDVMLSLIGIFMMVCAGYISSMKSQTVSLHILLVVFEPAGWFLVWISMEHLINTTRKEKPEIEFYSKMTKSKTVFLNT
ncbi:hypothetical protein CNR22_01680 [Sphingobacteriaceae bacterium]|nr:hypothetical protein CNR22_01680 [Sphingobacteriaceae bacterium]